jgi:hypothetical protein
MEDLLVAVRRGGSSFQIIFSFVNSAAGAAVAENMVGMLASCSATGWEVCEEDSAKYEPQIEAPERTKHKGENCLIAAPN